ncbi:MAG: hypothetical protein RR646_07945 [Erysipelotrichaceae bacterium]
MVKDENEILNTSFIDMDVIYNAQIKFNLTNEETFDMFIAPALDEAERQGKKFKFPFIPNLPIDMDGNYSQEWQYLSDKYGYTSFLQEDVGIWVLIKDD